MQRYNKYKLIPNDLDNEMLFLINNVLRIPVGGINLV